MKPRLAWAISLLIALGLLLALEAVAYARQLEATEYRLSTDTANELHALARLVPGSQALDISPAPAATPQPASNQSAALAATSGLARNDSTTTTCSKDQNVNVPLFADQVSRFEVKATNPTNPISTLSCSHTTSGCPATPTPATESCTTLFDNFVTVVQGCTVSGWWRGTGTKMQVTTPDKSGEYHYMRLIRKIEAADSWPQVMRLYQDGTMALKPHPPEPLLDSCFGSSVVIGPATPSSRPYAEISSVDIVPADASVSLDVTYKSSETAHIVLTVDRSEAVAAIDAAYATNADTPFATLRSMYVQDGNSDVDHAEVVAADYPIITGWTTLEASWWFFHRTVAHSGNESAPDIRITVVEQQASPTATATAVGTALTPTRSATATRTSSAQTSTPTLTHTRTRTFTVTSTPQTPAATHTATATPPAGELSAWARNDSVLTSCALNQNVNVPIFADQISRYEVKATNPTYPITTSACGGCSTSGCAPTPTPPTVSCHKLFEDGITVVEGCTMTGWWRGMKMRILSPDGSGDYHYLQLMRKIEDANSWPQVMRLYQDGTMKIKPHPPLSSLDNCFGSAVIIGPATPALQPFVDIDSVQVNAFDSPPSLDVTFKSGETAHITLTVNRSEAVAAVELHYAASSSIPFATFRSMYMEDGVSLVDHVQVVAGDYPIITGWTTLQASWWLFHRAIPSDCTQSAPDIRIAVLEQQAGPTATATPKASPSPTPGGRWVRVALPVILTSTYFEWAWEQEENNSYLTANGPILPRRDYLGHPNDSDDYFSIYLDRPGSIVVDMSIATPARDMQLQLYYLTPGTQTLTLVGYASGAPYHVSSSGDVGAGWYYIRVYTGPSSYSTEATYTLRAEFEE